MYAEACLLNSKASLPGNDNMKNLNRGDVFINEFPSLLHVHLVLQKTTPPISFPENESETDKSNLIQSGFLLLGTSEDMLRNPSFTVSATEFDNHLDSCTIFIDKNISSNQSSVQIINWSSCLTLFDRHHFISNRSIRLVSAKDSIDSEIIVLVSLNIIQTVSFSNSISQKQLLLKFPLTRKGLEFIHHINDIPIYSIDSFDQFSKNNSNEHWNPLSLFFVQSQSLLIPSMDQSPSKMQKQPSQASSIIAAEENFKKRLLNPFISPRQERVKSLTTKPNFIATELSKSQSLFCSYTKSCQLFCMTWNVAGMDVQPDLDLSPSLEKSFKNRKEEVPTICVFGFQEVDTRNEAYLYFDPTRKRHWETICTNGLYKVTNGEDYVLIGGGKQLVGLLVLVFVRKESEERVKDVEFSSLATGLLGVMGNKGAVVCRFRFDDSFITTVVCHFAADVDQVQRRNNEFQLCMDRLTTSIPSSYTKDGGVQEYIWSNPWIHGLTQLFKTSKATTLKNGLDGIPLWVTDYLFFLGDFNYRSVLPRSELIKLLPLDGKQGHMMKALDSDQLERERRSGRVFDGFNEALITFLPTYKFDIGTNLYDSSEKMRCPAWCDRILWRDQGDLVTNLAYDSCMNQIQSDHKPVCALFKIKLRQIDNQSLERSRVNLLRQLDVFENEATPTIELSESSIFFGVVRCIQSKVKKVVIVNTGKVWSHVSCIVPTSEKEWLSVTPATCSLFPGEKIDFTVEVKVPSRMVQDLNRCKKKLEGFLVFKVQDGCDVFCLIDCQWKPQSLGESAFVLCRLFDSIVSSVLPERFLELDEHIRKVDGVGRGVSVPKQISRLVDFIYQNGKSVPDVFKKYGEPIVVEYLLSCIEHDVPFDLERLFSDCKSVYHEIETRYEQKFEFQEFQNNLDLKIKPNIRTSVISHGKNVAIYSSVSLLFLYLKSLPNPIIPISSEDRCINEGYLSSIAARQVVTQSFKKEELNLFMYLITFFKDFMNDYNEQNIKNIEKEQLCKIIAPIFFKKITLKTGEEDRDLSCADQSKGNPTANPALNQGYFSYFSESILGYSESSRKIMFLCRFFDP